MNRTVFIAARRVRGHKAFGGRAAACSAIRGQKALWRGSPAGAPAAENTGSLVKVNGDGTFSTVVGDLDQPTSVEFIRNTAYVVTLTGQIWKVENPSSPPHGASH